MKGGPYKLMNPDFTIRCDAKCGAPLVPVTVFYTATATALLHGNLFPLVSPFYWIGNVFFVCVCFLSNVIPGLLSCQCENNWVTLPLKICTISYCDL